MHCSKNFKAFQAAIVPHAIHYSSDGTRAAAVKGRRPKLVALSTYLTRQLWNMLKSSYEDHEANK
jgi:hypothetical protein